MSRSALWKVAPYLRCAAVSGSRETGAERRGGSRVVVGIAGAETGGSVAAGVFVDNELPTMDVFAWALSGARLGEAEDAVDDEALTFPKVAELPETCPNVLLPAVPGGRRSYEFTCVPSFRV